MMNVSQDIQRLPSEQEMERRRVKWKAVLFAALVFWLLIGAVGIGLQWNQVRAVFDSPRSSVPLVVFESDDWGKGYVFRADDEANALQRSREVAILKRLTEILLHHKDSTGRSPIFSAFVVVGQADVDATLADSQPRYHWIPLDQASPSLVEGLKLGAGEGVLELEYHARDHRNANNWARAVRQAAADAEKAGKHVTCREITGLSGDYTDSDLLDRLFCDYYDEREGASLSQYEAGVETNIVEGLREFRRLFGEAPVCTIASRYYWCTAVEDIWRAHGIRYVHGVNYQRGPGVVTSRNRQLGYRTEGGLVGLARNACLDSSEAPLDKVERINPESCLQSVDRAIENGEPAVICSHSYTYTNGGNGTTGYELGELESFLSQLEQRHPNLRYLSSQELAEFAETGAVLKPRDDHWVPIKAASGISHLWLVCRGLFAHHLKARLWSLVMAVLLMLQVGLTMIAAAPRPQNCSKKRQSECKMREGG
jgi:hypothetical protein